MHKILIPLLFGLFFLAISLFFLVYGIKGGFMGKKILSHYPSSYATGSDAIKRGVFYVILGLIAFGGTIVSFLSIYTKLMENG